MKKMEQYNLRRNFSVNKYRNVYKLDHIQPNTSYGVYLYFFDEIRGHIPLFVYPTGITSKDERQILSIHSIWWHQDEFLTTSKFNTIDLELGGVIYSATLFFCNSRRTKRRFGMDSSKWKPERFVLIIKAPSEVSFIAQEILYELKAGIQNNIGTDLCFLVENQLEIEKDSEIMEFIKIKSRYIKQQLEFLSNSLIPKIPLDKLRVHLEKKVESSAFSNQGSNQILIEKQKKLHFSIPKGKKIKIQNQKQELVLGLKPKRVKIIQINWSDNNKIARVTVRNHSSDFINNALIKIYESQGFFGKNILISRIRKWEPKKDVLLEFEPTNERGTNYFLKIEDDFGLIKLKKIHL